MLRTFRLAGRICWFIAELIIILSNYFFTTAFVSKNSKRLARAKWLHRSSRRHLRIFDFTANIAGPIPKNGLLVSNHLSYLDILAISSITPAVFVSKAEVRGWPVFGWLAQLGGTVFVNRQRRTQVGEVNREIQTALDEGVLVVLFPEGTSSNGKEILPFKTSLLEPAVQQKFPLAVGWIHYEIDDGDASNEICYWGDHAFFPHLLNVLSKKSIRATVHFESFSSTADRKELAQQLREEILKLKNAAVKTI